MALLEEMYTFELMRLTATKKLKPVTGAKRERT